jgi:beta-glucanase (GH16 family)
VFEVVARVPAGLGTWPAIWLIDERGDPYREIDIMEAVGVTPDTVFSSVHAGLSLADLRHWSGQAAMPRLADGFHTYRLDWRRDALTIAIDGKTVLAMDPDEARIGDADPLRRPMQLRINLALGGSWGGRIDDAVLPARLEIRSVRIWQSA